MRIDIWSDVVCPWCYLGHRRFELALERLGDDAGRLEVHWRAFELDPRAPAEPQPLRPVLEKKYGPGAFDAMTSRLTALGAAEGLEYRFELAQRVNTFDAHRLSAWAAATAPERHDALVQRLFRSYFTEGGDVSDHATLVGLAGEVGLDAEVGAEVLAAGSFADEVRADEAAAREHDVTGVPAFVIEEQLLIPGAQDVDTLVRLIGRALERIG